MDEFIWIYLFITLTIVYCHDITTDICQMSNEHENPDIYIVVLKNHADNKRVQDILDEQKRKSLLKGRILPRTLHVYESKGFKGFSVAIEPCKESKDENGTVFVDQVVDREDASCSTEMTTEKYTELPRFLSFLDSIKDEIDYIEKDEDVYLSQYYRHTPLIDQLLNNSGCAHGVLCSEEANCYKDPWNLQKIRAKSWHGDPECSQSEALGEGVIIYLMDTGCNVNHSEFTQGQIIHGVSIMDEKHKFRDDLLSNHNDLNGHGTHVCGILVGNTHGIAKKAKVISVKIFRSDGMTSWALVLEGFSWIYEYAKKFPNKRHIINLSFNGHNSKAVLQRIKDMYEHDFLIFVAAGNQAQDACDRCPAKSDHVVTVGAVDQYGYICYFSNYGKCVDIFAPGQNIVSASSYDPSSIISLSGTSMACPHVTASVAATWSSLLDQPAHVIKCILFKACTAGIIDGLPPGSPNLFLYRHMLENTSWISQCIESGSKQKEPKIIHP